MGLKSFGVPSTGSGQREKLATAERNPCMLSLSKHSEFFCSTLLVKNPLFEAVDSAFNDFSQQAKVIHLLLRLLARNILDFRFRQHQA